MDTPAERRSDTRPQTDLSVLLGLQQNATRAEDEAALCFLVGNDTWHAVPYGQAFVFLLDPLGQPDLRVASGLVSTFEETPFKLWAQAVCAALLKRASTADGEPCVVTPDMLDAHLREGWAEWWPAHALLLPLASPRAGVLGAVIHVRETPWSPAECALLKLLHAHYTLCLSTFRRPHRGVRAAWQRLRQQPRKLALIGALLVALCLCPVRLTVIAPAEIIALQAEAVSAPVDGVIKSFAVQPNQAVKQGQLLFSMDDTTLRNQREVALRALGVAGADALATSQKAFDSTQSKGDLAALQGRVRQREAELAWLDEMLRRIEVHAAHDGVLIYSDANDWLGKPVVTGERIALLAQPDTPGVLVWVPVGDAITLQEGAEMRVFLQTEPLSPLRAELVQTSYQATPSPDGIAAYRIRGKLIDATDTHIGLRGVAKIYGAWRPLIYWVMRRPLGTLRQWAGL